MRADEFTKQRITFADGYLVLSNHFANDRSALRNISTDDVYLMLHRLEVSRSEDLVKLPYTKFVVRSHKFSLGMSKQRDKYGNTAYVVVTAHPTLKAGKDQDIFYLEEGWKDWVAGGAMALGALGAHGDASAATKQQINKPSITQQAKQQVKPGVTAQKIQQVAVPKKITPEQSRAGHTPEELKAYIQACAERYLPKEEIARFMGEVAHETNNFKSMIEEHPEKNVKHYGKVGNPLGNSGMEDAWRYIGRGFLQITGKYNYKHFGDKIRPGLGDELLKDPNMAMRKDVAAALAVVYWRERVAPKFQSGASSKEIAKAINGKKPKGLKDREAKTKQAASSLNTRRV